MRKRSIYLILVLTILTGCQSAPTKPYAQLSEGQWTGKALIRDEAQSRSYVVNLNFNARRDRVLRMDVSNPLFMAVASLVVSPEEVRYLLFDAKRFYYGPPQPGVMKPILALPFDPRWLNPMLFDQPIVGPSWTCSKDEQGRPIECQDAATALKVSWSARQGDRRTISVEHSKGSVQINLRSFKPKVEERKDLFILEAPSSFQKMRVR